ncbi:putative surface/cell-adhesion protein [Lachnospiraceae bacterium KM106-2]|nr:putative surface/cell-adhesion protein [Lachnospiraceae bacterium KM106-2]
MGKRMVNPTIRHFITKLLLIMFLFLPYSKIHATSNDIITKTLSGILNWQKMNYNLSSNDSLLASEFTDASGSSNADWFVFGMARSGVADYYHVYQNALSDGLITRYANRTELANEKPTEWHRLCLTILALGGDPTSITCSDTKQSINLIKDGVYDRSDLMSLKSQGLNSYIWALITIDSIRYPIPKESNCSRESLIQSILSYQLKDGGFSLSSTGCDVDITAMAIQALSPYYNLEQSFSYIRKCDGKKIDETIRSVIDRSLHILSQSQGKDGDFMSYGESNVESTSQVLVALCSLGIDYKTDSRFIKKGHTILDGILKYKQKDGGFAHCIQRDKHSDVMASGQVFYSLSALLRYKDHLRNLYDLRPSMDAKTTNRIASLTKKIQAITIHSKKDFISILYDEYCKIEPSERCYVHNYFQLSDAMKRNDLPISHPTLLSDF